MQVSRYLVRIVTALCAATCALSLLFSTPPGTAHVGPSRLEPVTTAATSGTYEMPADGPIVRHFDRPEQNWLPGHRGVDIAWGVGNEVRSPASGTIVFQGTVAGVPVVSIDHSDGIRTTYQPVETQLAAGMVVSQGQTIGVIALEASDPAISHCRTEPCLHWGARTGPDSYIDPLSLLGKRKIRLFWPQTMSNL